MLVLAEAQLPWELNELSGQSPCRLLAHRTTRVYGKQKTKRARAPEEVAHIHFQYPLLVITDLISFIPARVVPVRCAQYYREVVYAPIQRGIGS